MYVCMYVCTQPLHNGHIKVNLKIAGLNFKFSFSKAKEPILSYYLPIVGRKKRWVYAFLKGVSIK